MTQTTITKRERKTLVHYYLKEIEKQLQDDSVEHLQYFNGKLTVHNLKSLEKFLELDFEYSQSTERIYLRDAPYSYIDLDDIDSPDVVKCIESMVKMFRTTSMKPGTSLTLYIFQTSLLSIQIYQVCLTVTSTICDTKKKINNIFSPQVKNCVKTER